MSATIELEAPAALKSILCSPEEYLAREHAPETETRSEYYDGAAWPMTGASWNHIRIVGNLVRCITGAIGRDSFDVSTHDLKVQVGSRYFYPDIVVSGPQPHLASAAQGILLDPLVVIEVISHSTEAFDRGNKALAYRSLSSLQEYLLISQDAPQIDYYRRAGAGSQEWLLSSREGLDASLSLLQFGGHTAVQIPLKEIYERVLWTQLQTDNSTSS